MRALVFASFALLAGACTSNGSSSPTPGAASTASPTPTRPPITGWIAYQSARGGTQGIRLVRSDGTDDHEIMAADPQQHLAPSWSPDGNTLVFERAEASGAGSVWKWDQVSDRSVAITHCKAPCLSDEFPSFDPTGTRVTFVRTIGPLDSSHRAAECGIWIADLRSGTEKQLTSIPRCETTPSTPRWAADGKRIVYTLERWGRGDRASALVQDSSVWIVDVPNGAADRLVDWGRGAGDADWSPDGKWVVFATYPLSDFKCCYISNLYRIHPNGKAQGQLTPYSSKGPRATQPRYSSDSSWILFTASTSTSRNIWIMPAGGGQPFQLTSGGLDTRPTLQPAS